MRLLLVDLSGNFFPRWHAGADKELSHARLWTLNRIRNVAGKYDRVAICCEGRGPTWRKEKCATYKANRDAPPANLVEELRQTTEACEAEGWHVLRRDGFEADDLIASLAAWADEQGHSATILSDDKDFAQCLREGVIDMLKSDDNVRSVPDIEAAFGVPVKLMPQWQALVGDTSDNVVGVKGCGPKTASRLLTEHGDLEAIVRAAHEERITGAMADKIKLSDATGELALSLALVTLRTDALTDEECAAVLDEQAPTPRQETEDHYMDQPETETTKETTEEPQPDGTVTQTETKVETAPAEKPAAVPTLEAVAEATARKAVDYTRQLEPTSIGGQWKIAKLAFDSRMFSDWPTEAAIFAAIGAGRALGLGWVQSLMGLYNEKNKLAMHAMAMHALVMRSEQCAYIDPIEQGAECCTLETQRNGSPRPVQVSFTMQDARDAKLTTKKGEVWEKYGPDLLFARCVSRLCRRIYPDLVLGMYVEGERGGV